MENLTGSYDFTFDTTSPFRCTSANGHYFASPTIRMFGMPWILQYYPVWKDTGKGEVFLCLTSLPTNVVSIKTRRMIKYNETDQVFEEIDTFNGEHMNWGSKRSNMIGHSDLKVLSGSMKIEILEIKDSNGRSLYETFAAKYANTNSSDSNDNDLSSASSFVLSTSSPSTQFQGVNEAVSDCTFGEFHFSFDTKSKFRHESPNGFYFTSPTFRLFGLPWNIDFFPKWKDSNKGDTFLCLTDLPSHVATLRVRRVKMYKETGQVFEEIDSYTHEHHNRGSKLSNMITRTDLDTLSGSIRIELLEIRDQNGDSLYDEYVTKRKGNGVNIGKIINAVKSGSEMENLKEKWRELISPQKTSTEDKQMVSAMLESISMEMEKLTNAIKEIKDTVKQMEIRMDQIEEKKSDDGDLQKQIDDIRKSVSRLQSGRGMKGDSDAEKFRQWLEGTVKLGEYYDLFVENGVENVSVVQMFGMEELTMIGINKIGHRLQLKKAIDDLKGNDSKPDVVASAAKQPAEGGPTAII